MAKFLDYQGLTQFWAKIKTWVYTAVTTNSPSKSKTVTGMQDGKVTYGNIGIDASQVETGTMPIARGGTGSGTAAGARSNLDVYSKSETESLVAGRIVVVQTLPATGQAGVIYYVGPSGSGGDQYEEYIWDTNNAQFVKVGEKSLDLSEYVNDLVTNGTGDYVVSVTKSGQQITVQKGSLPSASTSQKGIVQLAGSIGATVASENNKAATEKAVRDAINALDSNKTSTDGSNVQVKVTVTDGKVTAVNVTTDNTENKNNKVTAWSATTTDAHYPSEKLVKMSLDGKADKVDGATVGNFATFDSSGNIADTGKSESSLSVLEATKLKTARSIDGVSFDGSTNVHHFGSCATAAGTAAKTVTLDDSMAFTLEKGASVFVKFQYANGVASPTLNVNGTGAKNIYRYGTTAPSTTAKTSWQAGSVVHLVYDGTYWQMVGWLNDDTTYSNASLGQGYGTCSTAEATAAKAVTLSSYSLVTGGIVAVKFTYGLCASATMNINSKGAKSIFIHGAAVTATTAKEVKAGDIAYFIYDGTQYQFLGTDRMEKDAVVGFSDTGTAGTDAKVQYEKGDGTKGDLMVAITDAEINALT